MNPLLIAAAAGAGLLLYKGLGKAPPKGSEPTEIASLRGVKPTYTTATAVSGRQYDLWAWQAPDGSGQYAVAQTRGPAKPVWIAFTSNSSGKKVPAKTNVSEVVTDATAAQALISAMRSDWGM